MRRLLAFAVVAAAVQVAPAHAQPTPKCPPALCDLLDQCYDTGEVWFCL